MAVKKVSGNKKKDVIDELLTGKKSGAQTVQKSSGSSQGGGGNRPTAKGSAILNAQAELKEQGGITTKTTGSKNSSGTTTSSRAKLGTDKGAAIRNAYVNLVNKKENDRTNAAILRGIYRTEKNEPGYVGKILNTAKTAAQTNANKRNERADTLLKIGQQNPLGKAAGSNAKRSDLLNNANRIASAQNSATRGEADRLIWQSGERNGTKRGEPIQAKNLIGTGKGNVTNAVYTAEDYAKEEAKRRAAYDKVHGAGAYDAAIKAEEDARKGKNNAVRPAGNAAGMDVAGSLLNKNVNKEEADRANRIYANYVMNKFNPASWKNGNMLKQDAETLKEWEQNAATDENARKNLQYFRLMTVGPNDPRYNVDNFISDTNAIRDNGWYTGNDVRMMNDQQLQDERILTDVKYKTALKQEQDYKNRTAEDIAAGQQAKMDAKDLQGRYQHLAVEGVPYYERGGEYYSVHDDSDQLAANGYLKKRPEDYDDYREDYDRLLYDYLNGKGSYWERIEALQTDEEAYQLEDEMDRMWEAIENGSIDQMYSQAQADYMTVSNEATGNYGSAGLKNRLDEIDSEIERQNKIRELEENAPKAENGVWEYDPSLVKTYKEDGTTIWDGFHAPGEFTIKLKNEWQVGDEVDKIYQAVGDPFNPVGADYEYGNMEDLKTLRSIQPAYYMTPEQKQTFLGYYLSGDKESAKAFYDALVPSLNMMADAHYNSMVDKMSRNEYAPLMIGARVLLPEIAGAVSTIGSIKALFGDKDAQKADSEYYRMTNALNTIQAARSDVWGDWAAEHFGEEFREIGEKSNGLAYSIIDNARRQLITKGATAPLGIAMDSAAAKTIDFMLLGSDVMGNTMAQEIKNGRRPDEAFVRACGSAIIEVVTENMWWDKLFSADVKDMLGTPGQFAKYMKNIFQSEGLEEVSGNVMDAVFDDCVSALYGHRSELNEKYHQLIDQGKTPEEAGWEVGTDFMKEAGWAYLSGGLSALISGGARGIAARTENRIAETSLGKTAIQHGTQNIGNKAERMTKELQNEMQIISAAEGMDPGTESRKLANELREGFKKGKGVDNRKFGQLIRTVMNESNEKIGDIVQNALGDTLKEQLITAGEKEADAIELSQILMTGIVNQTLTPEMLLAIHDNENAMKLWREYRISDEAQQAQEQIKPLQIAQKSVMDLIVDPKEIGVSAESVSGMMAGAQAATAEDIAEADAQGKRSGSAMEVIADGLYGEITGFTTENVQDKDGKNQSVVMVQIGEGAAARTVDISQVKGLTDGAAQVLQVIGADRGQVIGNETGKALLQIASKAKDVTGAVTDAMNTMWAAVMEQKAPKTNLDKTTQETIANAVRADMDAAEAERVQNWRAIKPGQGTTTFNGYSYGTQEFNDAIGKLGKTHLNEANVIGNYAKSMGMDVQLYYDEKESAKQGAFYGGKDGAGIRINLAGTINKEGAHRSAVATFAHEVTHNIEANSPTAYKALRSFVLQNMGSGLQNSLQHIMDNYAAHGESIDLNGALAELVAMGSEQVLTNEKLAAQLKEQDTTLYGRVQHAVNRLLKQIRGIRGDVMTTSSRYARAMQNVGDEMARIWAAAYEEAKGTTAPAETAGNRKLSVVQLTDGTNIAIEDANILNSKPDDMSMDDFVHDYLESHVGESEIVQATSDVIYLGKALPSEYISSKYTNQLRGNKKKLTIKNRAAGMLLDAIVAANNKTGPEQVRHNNKNAKYGVYRYTTRIAFPIVDSKGRLFDYKAYTAKMIVNHTSQNELQLYDIIGINKDDQLGKKLLSESAGGLTKTIRHPLVAANKITQNNNNGKSQKSISEMEKTYESLNIDPMVYFKGTMEQIDAAIKTEKERAEEFKKLIERNEFMALEFIKPDGRREILHASTRPGIRYQLSYIGKDGVPTMHQNYGLLDENAAKNENVHSMDELYQHFVSENIQKDLNFNIMEDNEEPKSAKIVENIIREKENTDKITERKATGIMKNNGEIAYAPAAYSFAGEQAKDVFGEDVRKAYRMEKEGATDEEIRDKTNCIRGFNGRWWRILDNNEMKLKIPLDEIEIGKTYSLKSIYDAEELYKAYPLMGMVPVRFNKLENDTMAQVSGSLLHTITYNSDYLSRGTDGIEASLQHEIQHIIQEIEWSNRGANVTLWKNLQDIARARIASNDKFIKRLYEKYGIDDQKELAWGIGFNDDGTIDEEYLFPEELEKVKKMTSQELELYKKIEKDNSKWLKLLRGDKSPSLLYRDTVGEIEARAASEKTGKDTKIHYPSSAIAREDYTEEVTSRPGATLEATLSEQDAIDHLFGKTKASEKFSMQDPVEERADGLIAVHNLSAEQLMKTLKLGGFAMPSIAIIKSDYAHNRYGDISVVFYPQTIDPKASKYNKVYGGDAWTPTYPGIEYKINSKELDKIYKKVQEALPDGLKGIQGLVELYDDNFEHSVNGRNGDVISATERNMALELAYLKDKGISIEYPTKAQSLAGTSRFSNDQVIRVAEELGKDLVDEAYNGGYEYFDAHPEVKDRILKTLNDQWKEKHKDIGLKIANMDLYSADKFGYANWDTILMGAFRYFNNGLSQEIDEAALKDQMEETIDKEDYKQWRKELFKNVIEKQGIRNNKDLFTDSGNRRSWDALHDPETLENVVRIMRSEEEKGANAFFSQSAMLALGTRNFRSIDEIRKHSDQLKHISDEEMSAAKTNIVNGFSELMDELYDRGESNIFIARDRALQAMVEAVRKSKSAAGINRELRQWHGLNVTDDMGERIAALIEEVANLPTEYFEAKPQRGVGFDEIAKVIIPQTASQELVDALDAEGINYETYDGTDEDRLRALNEQENAIFSFQDDTDYDVKAWMETVPEWSLRTEAEKALLRNYGSMRRKNQMDGLRMEKIDAEIRRLEGMQGKSATAEGTPVTTVTVDDVLKKNGIVQDGAMLKQNGVIIGSLRLGVLNIYDKYKEIRKALQNSGAFEYDEKTASWTTKAQNIHADQERDVQKRLEELRIKKQNLQGVIDQTSEQLAKITGDEGFGAMMYQQQKVLNSMENIRTKKELTEHVGKLERAVKVIEDRIAANRKAVEKLNQSDSMQTIREILESTTAKQAAAELKKEFHSTWKQNEILPYISEIMAKMTAGEDYMESVEDLAEILMTSDTRNTYEGLSALRGLTITIGKSEQRELKAKNSSLAEIRQKLEGTGIKVKYGETSTLDKDVADLRAEYPTMPEFGNDLDALDEFIGWVNGMRGRTEDEFYEQHKAEATAKVLQKVAAVMKNGKLYVPADSKARQQIMDLVEYMKGLNAETEEAQRTLEDVAKQLETMKQESRGASGKAAVLMRDVNVALDYYNRISRIAVDEAKQKNTSAVIEQLKSEQAQKILKNNEEWRQLIERDKNARDQLDQNRKTAAQINTSLKRMYNLLKNPKGTKNIPEYMQGLAREVLGIFAANDTAGGRRFLNATQDGLKELNRLLEAWEKQDGPFNPADLSAAEEAVTINLLQDLDIIRDGITAINTPVNGKNKLDTLQQRGATLKNIQEAVSEIYSAIRAENEVQIGDRRVAVEDAAYKVAAATQGKNYREWTGKMGGAIRTLHKAIISGNMTPEYFFRTVGNEGLNDLWETYHWAENRNGLELAKAQARLDEIAKQHGYKNWDMGQTVKLQLESGETELTLGQVMSLWATWKREKTLGPQMSEHLTKGGFYAEKDLRDGLLGRAAIERKAHRVTEEDMAKVRDLLTDEQRKFVDDVVLFMSRDMSALGNAASMAAYGIKMYKERYYFPFQMWDGVKSRKSNDAGSAAGANDRAFHPSFSKSRMHGANNALVIGDFMQTAADHIAGMINYATMGLANESMQKVLNQQTAQGPYETKRNTRAILEEAYGKEVMQYLAELQNQLNGGAVRTSRSLGDKAISIFRKNAVAGSLSVALQQPLSYIRAAMLINPKYLTKASLSEYWKNSYKERMAYSGVSVIKEMGRFDMALGQSAREYLTPDGKESTGRKIWEGVKEYSTILPELMDRWTWNRMWVAVKAEQHALHPEMDVKSDEFLTMVGERFNELMRRTQVYDSVLVKSANMRSDNYFVKSMTSFMAEPTLTINVLADAVRMAAQKEKGGKMQLAKAGATFILSAVLQAAFKGLMSSGRTPDEKKTWFENFLYRFFGNLLNEADPLQLVPGYSDAITLLKDGKLQDDAMGAFGKLFTAGQKGVDLLLGNGGKNGVYRDIEDSVGQLVQLFSGLPLKNLMRDARAMWNWVVDQPYAKRPDDWNSIKYQTIDTFMNADNLWGVLMDKLGESGYDTSNAGYYQRIYAAKKAGDEQAAQDMIDYLLNGKGVKAETISSKMAALAKADNSMTAEATAGFLISEGKDPTDYIKDQLKAGSMTAEEARKMLQEADPQKNPNDVWWAVDRIQYQLDNGLEKTPGGSYYRLWDAMDNNSTEQIRGALNTMTDHGIETKNIKTQITKQYKAAYLEADANGKRQIRDAIQKAYKLMGLTAEDADKVINKWK